VGKLNKIQISGLQGAKENHIDGTKKTWLINCTVLLLSSLLSALSFRLALYSCFISRFLLFPSSSLSALVLLSLDLCSFCFLAHFVLLLSSSLFALAV